MSYPEMMSLFILRPFIVNETKSHRVEPSLFLPEGFERVLRLALLVDEGVEGFDVEVGLLGVSVKGPDEEGGAQTQQLVLLPTDHEVEKGRQSVAGTNEVRHWKTEVLRHQHNRIMSSDSYLSPRADYFGHILILTVHPHKLMHFLDQSKFLSNCTTFINTPDSIFFHLIPRIPRIDWGVLKNNFLRLFHPTLAAGPLENYLVLLLFFEKSS